jgi:dethiobiotin synthetase
VTVAVVAGTDTGVGKTVVTAALAAVARAGNRRVAVVKPVQTGVAETEPGDLDEVRRLAGVDDLHELARLPHPLAPATAARLTGSVLPTVADAAEAVDELRGRDLVLVEGSGGLMVHLDGQGGTIADLALALEATVLVVARAGLGTLNHTALTCEALRVRGVRCRGVVIGAWPREPDMTARCNLADLPTYSGEAVVGLMPEGSGALDPSAFLDAASGALTEEVLI